MHLILAGFTGGADGASGARRRGSRRPCGRRRGASLSGMKGWIGRSRRACREEDRSRRWLRLPEHVGGIERPWTREAEPGITRPSTEKAFGKARGRMQRMNFASRPRELREPTVSSSFGLFASCSCDSRRFERDLRFCAPTARGSGISVTGRDRIVDHETTVVLPALMLCITRREGADCRLLPPMPSCAWHSQLLWVQA